MWKLRGVSDAPGPKAFQRSFCTLPASRSRAVSSSSGSVAVLRRGLHRHPATARNGAVPEEHWLRVAAGGASKAGPSCGRSLAWCDDAFCCERAYSDCGLCSSMSVRGAASSLSFANGRGVGATHMVGHCSMPRLRSRGRDAALPSHGLPRRSTSPGRVLRFFRAAPAHSGGDVVGQRRQTSRGSR